MPRTAGGLRTPAPMPQCPSGESDVRWTDRPPLSTSPLSQPRRAPADPSTARCLSRGPLCRARRKVLGRPDRRRLWVTFPAPRCGDVIICHWSQEQTNSPRRPRAPPGQRRGPLSDTPHRGRLAGSARKGCVAGQRRTPGCPGGTQASSAWRVTLPLQEFSRRTGHVEVNPTQTPFTRRGGLIYTPTSAPPAPHCNRR